jgi:transposase
VQGHKWAPEESLFIYQDPYGELPRSRFYEALEQHLDLEWVREATRGLYAEGVGRPSLDPVVFVKLNLVSYFENIVTDSELAFRAADSLTIRRFLGYGLEERTPERTTILKCRQRWPEEMFAMIFRRVLEQLAGEGLVKGEHLGTDTVLIDANAAMDSLRHREFGVSYEEFVRALYSQEATSASEAAAKDAHRPKKGSNAEWVSATDPEAAVAVHPDGHTGLSYRLDATVDLETGAVVQIGAEPGNVRDNVDLPQRLEEAKANLQELGLTPTDVTADRGHHSQENVIELEAMGVAPIIRARTQSGPAGFREQDFEYRAEGDEYLCPAGQRLTRRSCSAADGRVHYRASGETCQQCEHFGVCTKSANGRTITRAAVCEQVERNRERVQSVEGRYLLGRHRQRAEGPWSYAKLYGGLARLGPRGLANAIKKALVQGIGWNVMKLIAHLTGLRPRGWSEAAWAPRSAGLGAVLAPLCALFAALCWLWATAIARGRARPNRSRPETLLHQHLLRWRFLRFKGLLSRGC